MKKWKILIVTNNKIIPEYYQNDQKFNGENWTFFNVSPSNRIESSERFNVINALDIPNYEFLGKDWAESEVIYNVGKLNLFSDYEYLGIIHWDFNLYAPDFKTYRITENIDRILEKFDWISFFPVSYLLMSKGRYYDVMMDERKPNCLLCNNSGLDNPKSVNYFLQDYIKNIIPEINVDNIKDDTYVSFCCSFLTKREIFSNISQLISNINNTTIFDKFDTEKRHRYPGNIYERMVALISAYQKQYPFKLEHNFIGGKDVLRKDRNCDDY